MGDATVIKRYLRERERKGKTMKGGEGEIERDDSLHQYSKESLFGGREIAREREEC